MSVRSVPIHGCEFVTECPTCNADKNRPCKSGQGIIRQPHVSRMRLARDIAEERVPAHLTKGWNFRFPVPAHQFAKTDGGGTRAVLRRMFSLQGASLLALGFRCKYPGTQVFIRESNGIRVVISTSDQKRATLRCEYTNFKLPPVVCKLSRRMALFVLSGADNSQLMAAESTLTVPKFSCQSP